MWRNHAQGILLKDLGFMDESVNRARICTETGRRKDSTIHRSRCQGGRALLYLRLLVLHCAAMLRCAASSPVVSSAAISGNSCLSCHCSSSQIAISSPNDISSPTMHLRGGAFAIDAAGLRLISERGPANICPCRILAMGNSIDIPLSLSSPENVLHEYQKGIAEARLQRPPKLSRCTELN